MDFFSILILFFIVLISVIFAGIFYDAIWVPTKKKDYDRIARLADLRSGMIFYDLGSGNANMLFYLSKKYDVNCVGIEVSPFWYVYSKIKSLFYRKVRIKYGNFYSHDISRADVVFAFLLPKTYPKLKNKFNEELKKEAKLVLSNWPFKSYEPNSVSKGKDLVSYYLYQKQ